MRRLFLTIVALLVLVSSTKAFAEGDADADKGAEKQGKPAKHHHKKAHHHHAGAAAASENNGGPFADVPRGHWAYDAVQKAAEAGILQGWNNRFHGNKVVNRYQMAVVVARMLDRVGVLRANGKVITAQDIANLESLVIEFADELALLNVKVSTLEDTVAGLKKDVDLIKADLRGVGARAGITGEMDVRYVFADDSAPGYRVGPFIGLNSSVPNSAATAGITRYSGSQVSGNNTGTVTVPGTTGPSTFNNRDFFTVANFAINIDREFDPHTHFHAQLNINAEGEADGVSQTAGPIGAAQLPTGAAATAGNASGIGTPFSGRGNSFTTGTLKVNELYVVFDDWFTEGVNGRLGIWALPMNTEVNGPSRTYLWTITPSIANSKWESLRPVGLDIFQHNDKDSWMFYVGFFTPGDTSNGQLRSGTLLSANTAVLSNAGGAALTQSDLLPNPGLPGSGTFGRFPTPLGFSSMTDAAQGVDGQTLANDDIGFYGMIGQHPTCKDHRGFSWHIAYFDRNGNIHRGGDGSPSLTDWNAWQGFLSYQWTDVLLMAQYYDGTSKNYSYADLGFTPAGFAPVDARRFNSTPFANLFGEDTRSESFMALLNWQFTKRGNLTLRYEDAHDRTGVAELEAEVWTFAFNWRTSDHGWLQVEYIDPTTRSTSENGIRNTLDVNDNLVQINYKLAW